MKFGRFFGRSCVSCFGDTKPLKLTDSSPLEMLGLGSFFSFFFARLSSGSCPCPVSMFAILAAQHLGAHAACLGGNFGSVAKATTSFLPTSFRIPCRFAVAAGPSCRQLRSSVSWWPGWVPRAPEGALGGPLRPAASFRRILSLLLLFFISCWHQFLQTMLLRFGGSPPHRTSWIFTFFLLLYVSKKRWLVGGFNPFEKYESKWDSSQIGMKIKNIWNHQLDEGPAKFPQTLPAFLVIEATKSQ